MAIILPLITAFFSTPGVLPALFIGVFIMCLAFYRYRIEKYEDENLDENGHVQAYSNHSASVNSVVDTQSVDTEACTDCSCGKNPGGGGCGSAEESNKIKKISILYGTTTGNSKDFAWKLAKEAEEEGFEYDVNNVANIEAEEFLPQEASNPKSVLVLIMPTYEEGTPPDTAKWFYNWLEESSTDFRVGAHFLKGLKFAVFGLGNSEYKDHFNTVGKNCDKFLFQLSAERISPLCLGDENPVESKNGSIEEDFAVWKDTFLTNIQKRNDKEDIKQEAVEEEEEYESDSESEQEQSEDEGDGLVDLEDLGKVMVKAKTNSAVAGDGAPKEMLTTSLRKSLTKQGYKLVGSHSGVKICRWTKAMLRGRGGCYKHTFYGIESHRCMETTPSLACANKCVFCWRHHSNPVGTEWKWAMDPPDMILNGALEGHYKMIKQMKGVPGVLPERYAEGFKVRHCALSLVGEPIMYPEINKYVDLLHSKEISSFMVTNAQFPDAMKMLKPVTQLYVSIDASTKEELKKIDRPLHKDFWERFIESLKELDRKNQRTVYRLTLVKGWNADEIESYAKLVSLGKPDLIEVKGVTYCGTSKASKLTMENVPWHEEVIYFVKKLVERLPDYDISCEHEHSNCLLITHKKFLINGVWNTWIDYDKFHVLYRDFEESNGEKRFSAVDYMLPTPTWALFGSKERGFDPVEKRFHKKRGVNRNDG